MRVLIATLTAGGGHLAAAAALDEAWRALRPGDTVERVDLLRFFSRLHKKIHAEGYLKLVERAPELWGLVFKKTDSPAQARKLARFRSVFTRPSSQRFARCVRQFKPDVVLCTHYLPLDLLGRLRSKSGPPKGRVPRDQNFFGKSGTNSAHLAGAAPAFLTVSVVTDFEAHALWMDAGVDLYCVAAEETKARLVARGALAGNVHVTGIPISARFSKPLDVRAIRQRYGLRDDQPVLLVLGGGFGMGPVAQILTELDKTERRFQTMVVAGHNEDLRRELAVQDRRHPTHVLGFATNMHELMAVADLILTKPGGLTSSEALATGKPLFILNPIPGQEAANSDFLLEHGAAAKVNRVEDLPYRVEQLLGSKKLVEMARAARALGRPGAAVEVCRAVSKRALSPAPS